jgi:hypothetical protein
VKCIDNYAGAIVNNNPIKQYGCSTTNANQRWYHTLQKLLVLNGSSYCARAVSFANGAKVQLYACNAGDANQQWTRSGSTFYVTSGGVNYCLDNTGVTTDGVEVTVYTCNGNNNQNWSEL